MTAPTRIAAYLELVRLPNVFTALADVAMGFFVTQGAMGLNSLAGSRLAGFALLFASSASLYLAGMALNDAFDVDIDRAERPDRPIPSGRVPLATARRLGIALLACGILFAAAEAVSERDYRPAVIGAAIAAAVLAYDWGLKRTFVGPLGMGLCRFLNVLLGMSLSAEAWQSWHYVVAAGIGVYIVGVTWFARTEARPSNRLALALATLIGAGGVALLVLFPRLAPAETLVAAVRDDPRRWNLLWGLLGTLIAWRCVWAIIDPRPLLVQRAVRQCIFSLIMLDAVVTLAVAGMAPAILIVLLLVPTMFLGRFIYST